VKLRFEIAGLNLAIVRLPADSPLPTWATNSTFISITRTADELSIVCPATRVAPGVPSEKPWACLKILGPIPLTLSGVLAAFIAPLVRREIPIFAISTYDTDYVLVSEQLLNVATAALQDAGHEFVKR
jgi:uncharacterized protein